MPVRLLLFYLILFAGFQSAAQQYNYVHYDVKDGLAGSTVYDMCQDREGFLWFATENGLSRFDGAHFTNFTVKDGLPDNEVLQLLPDSRGRLWIATFSRKICYFFKGTFFTTDNDPMLKKIRIEKTISSMNESDNGTVAFCTSDFVSVVKGDSVLNFSAEEIYHSKRSCEVISNTGSLFLMVWGDQNTYKFNEVTNRFDKIRITYVKSDDSLNLLERIGIKLDSNTHPVKWVQWNKGVVSLERNRHGSYISFFTTTGGAFEVDSVNNKIGEQFLAGKKISHTKRDTEGELWFTTLGEGVYKLVSRSIQTITAEDGEDKRSNEVFCIARYGKDILAGCVFSKMMLVDAQKQSKRVLNFEKFMLHSELPYDNNRTYAIKVLKDGAPVVGFDGFLLKLDGQKLLHKTIFPNKSIDEVNDSTILLGTRYGAYLLNSKDLRVMDTVWKHRATKVYVFNDRYYIGTLDGLYEVDKNKKSLYLGEADPALTRRTVDIVSDNSGILWIASSDAGVVGYKEGRIVRRIDEQAGLSSNICKSLFMDKQVLWVGTNKGVNKIRLDNPAEPIRYYSTTDGLPSDIINAIYVEDSIVWLGSPAGLTRFNENRISAFSFCSLKLLNVTVSGENRSIDSSLQLHYRDNNISFAYTAISLKSGKEVKYYYRLKGLNNEWQQTQQNNLYYQSLPAGKYELELYAVNKYGVKSDVIHYSFVIETPYWASWWFYAIIILCVIALTGWLVNRRNQKKRALLEQKNKVQQQFAALEQQALQAQMNPHFIFNCLNSIQQYILTNNKTKANEYLTGFASLIRQTLDNSAKKSITVAEEIRYLSTYLEMEKMRFGDNFTYTLHVDGRINASFLEMPALLLQPYVENAIRHGIRHRETGMGEVDISFELEGEVLICRICDNGIGRQKAIELKSRQHIEYQSKGMSLTGKRIELLNKMDDKHINVTINDLYQPDGTAAGTEVILKIPV